MMFLIAVLLFSIVAFSAECPVQPSIEGPVHYYGSLKARENSSYIDGSKNGAPAQIRGVSFFWSIWAGRFYNANAVERLAKDWKAEVVRAAYGSTEEAFSDATVQPIKNVVEAAISNDIYVIIDWHSHKVAQSAAETQRAIGFFREMARLYGSCAHVIFELYNEPINTDWQSIKNYAEAVIPVIREHSPSNLILVGTPEFSRRVENVVGKAITDINVGYVLHFYAASHPLGSWRDNVDLALRNKLPIFVTEYGTTTADGGCSLLASTNCEIDNYNTHNPTNSDQWHAYMDRNKISSAAWSVYDKYEGSAFFGITPDGDFDQSAANWVDTNKMTASGKYIFKKLNEYYKTAPWNPGASPIKPIVTAGSLELKFFEGAKLAVNLPQAGEVSLEIFSLHGRKLGNLLNGYQNSGIFEFSLSHLKSGTYILFLKQGSQTKSMKIAKK